MSRDPLGGCENTLREGVAEAMRVLLRSMVCLCIVAVHSYGQVSLSVTGGAGSTGVSPLRSSYQVRIGGFYRIFDRVDIGLSASYQEVSNIPSDYALTFVPITVEGRFHFTSDGIAPYLIVGVGVAHLEYNYEAVYVMPIDFGKYQVSAAKQFYNDNEPIFTVGGGLTIPLSQALGLDLGYRITLGNSRFEMQRVSYSGSPIDRAPNMNWLLTQWSVGIRWTL